jgi:hypothetical protein
VSSIPVPCTEVEFIGGPWDGKVFPVPLADTRVTVHSAPSNPGYVDKYVRRGNRMVHFPLAGKL